MDLAREPHHALLVFTDLDGSLLDADDYSFRAAEPALGALRRARIPLILVTSKTRAEVEVLRRELGNSEPFIVENGGGIFFAHSEGRRVAGSEKQGDYDVVRLGTDYASIRAFVAGVGRRFRLRGFGDMLDDEVAALTGLDLQAARRARQREFTEPFVLQDEGVLDELGAAAQRRGIRITHGGRLHHLVGTGQDKGKAVRIVAEALSESLGKVRTVGLGDGANDLPMLETVDVAIVIPRPDGTRLELARGDATVAPLPGSRGWNSAVLDVVGGP